MSATDHPHPRDMRVGTAGPRATCYSTLPPNMTQFSRHLSELVVTQAVMSGNRQKANYEQGPTERCTVCHTVYPQCDTCSKYGRRGMHSLDQDKFRNAHDNPGFTDDSGALQSHWMKKDKKVPTNYILHFTDKLISKHVVPPSLLTLFIRD